MRKQKGKTTKITINVWRPVWSRLEAKIAKACLKRDAYLNALIDREIDRLDAEVSISNSEIARKYISQQLRSLSDFTPLSIALDRKTVDKIDDVCSRKRIVRDSFFNRLFLFLAIDPQRTGALLFSGWPDDDLTAWTRQVWSECKHDGPFFESVFDPFSALEDPLWPIRSGLDLIAHDEQAKYVDWPDPESGEVVKMARDWTGQFFVLPRHFYTVVLTDSQLAKRPNKSAINLTAPAKPGDHSPVQFHNLYGLNCYLPNHYVPTHPDGKALQNAIDSFISDDL